MHLYEAPELPAATRIIERLTSVSGYGALSNSLPKTKRRVVEMIGGGIIGRRSFAFLSGSSI